jgi:hypothetical protein
VEVDEGGGGQGGEEKRLLAPHPIQLSSHVMISIPGGMALVEMELETDYFLITT